MLLAGICLFVVLLPHTSSTKYQNSDVVSQLKNVSSLFSSDTSSIFGNARAGDGLEGLLGGDIGDVLGPFALLLAGLALLAALVSPLISLAMNNNNNNIATTTGITGTLPVVMPNVGRKRRDLKVCHRYFIFSFICRHSVSCRLFTFIWLDYQLQVIG